MGIITERKRRQRARQRRGRLLIAAIVLLGAALAAAPEAREVALRAGEAVQAIARSTRTQVDLPAWEMAALQLAVFDSGERAASEAQRLQSAGVRCIVWQREKMRIVCSVARTKDALDVSAAKGRDAYVIEDKLEEMTLAVSGSAAQTQTAAALLRAPDDMLRRLLDDGAPLDAVVLQTREIAKKAQRTRAENALHNQLAEGLLSWCDLMDAVLQEEADARSYAVVTMYTLCRELRAMLKTA